MELIEGDCLEVMKDLSDNSVDFLFCDLPYGQTSCKWDCLIDLDLFWKQVNRVCKQDAVMAFTCSVKFGNTLINSNPKCFRYDLVWVKSAACGFLNAKKMPMKKHEMVYIFYRKLAKVYTENIALHHTHKFLKATPNSVKTNLYSSKTTEKPRELYRNEGGQYTPPLPNSVIKEENVVVKDTEYENREIKKRNTIKKEENYGKEYLKKKENFRAYNKKLGAKGEESHLYEPPLPNSVIKEEIYGKEYLDKKTDYNERKNGESRYNPPLPNSVIKEENVVVKTTFECDGLYGKKDIIKYKNSDGTINKSLNLTRYEPPLPNSILEIKSEKGKHATQKPVPLMEYLIKYFTREGETVLDPTMGSGGTGIACKNLNRKFIGIEMDKDIFDVAVERNK